MRVFTIVFITFLVTSPVISQDTYTLQGRVIDEHTRQPLPSANIRVEGTTRGTVSNTNGEYRLPLNSGSHTIIISYIGYRSDTTHITVPRQPEHYVSLSSIPIALPGITVTDEDPAIEIIRRAIENKPRWRGDLDSYTGYAFARDKLLIDSEINTISEAYSDVHWHRQHGIREIVTQRRQSANLPADFQLARMGEIVNFNDDEIDLAGFTFIGVTAPNALRYYDYQLTGIRKMDGLEIFDIRVIPRTRLQPLFKGYISIADETYAVMEVDLVPNEAFHMPVIQQLHAHYQQQYRLYDDRFWMPTNFRFEAGFTFALTGFRIADFVYEKSAVIYEYDINIELPDTIFPVDEPFTVAEEAARFDSTFWAEHDVLPLTFDEKRAYGRIDSLVTYGDNRRDRTGPLQSLLRAFDYIDGRFNRVEGFYLGGKVEFDDITPFARFFGSLGYAFSDDAWKYSAGAVLYPTRRRIIGVGAELYNRTATIPGERRFGALAVSAAALFDKNDYLDYYHTDGRRTFVELNIDSGSRFRRQTLRVEVGYTDEKHATMENNTNFSIFSRDRTFRENPAIREGRLRSVTFRAARKPAATFFLLPAGFVWEVSLEHTSPSFAGSDFDFTRLFASVQGRVPTMYRRHALSPVLSYFIVGGFAWTDVPPQRLFELQSDLSGYAAAGALRGVRVKEFGGEGFIQLSLEHNFRRIPFLALGVPFLYEMGLEFLVHASIARSWNVEEMLPTGPQQPQPTEGWYTEFGIGLGKIFELLRIDLTWRVMEPSGFHVTFGISELF